MIYFLPDFLPSLSLRTFLTIFCSSIKNALTMRSRTQLPQREPPYARRTVFWALEVVAYSRGRRAGTCLIPLSVCSQRRRSGEVLWTYAWELGAAVTTFRGCAALLDVQESEAAAGGLDDADFVGAGVVAM